MVFSDKLNWLSTQSDAFIKNKLKLKKEAL